MELRKGRPAEVTEHIHLYLMEPMTTENMQYVHSMQLLDKDFPQSIYCHFCKHLHPIEVSKQAGYLYFLVSETPPPCTLVGDYTPGDIQLSRVVFPLLQYALKLHRLGLNTTLPLDAMRGSRWLHR
jgi:hypothetical protein